ncbi:unnamed protein product [Arabis nemorensis]|uniref:TF-B3 domain-containing protein n=1 Tax=Arabis nemorensis TaxID=586526 RepID=A0A565CB44_9BRAS|nr:unnamed protein product [Arabis nemorensis]
MANLPLKSPTNPHFFQPLLSSFDTHLKIPIAFFSKYIEGQNEKTTVKLRSDTSDKTSDVKIDGRRLTKGWKDFATTHDLRVGDIIIFKHEGDMVFNVTPFGSSFCEIQYSQSHIIKEEDDDIVDIEDDNHLPAKAARSNILNKGSHEMIIVNKEGKSWTLTLKVRESDKSYYIRRGWRSLCHDNRQRVGDLIVFNLVGDGKATTMLCICPEDKCS